jgi:hypothetical protein
MQKIKEFKMNEKCFATVVENRLLCSLIDADWHFFIRRLDAENSVPFSEFHKKEITSAGVSKFIPNWRTFHWNKIKNSMAGKSESYAKDVEFEINIYSLEHSTKKHQDVVDAFIAFMNHG